MTESRGQEQEKDFTFAIQLFATVQCLFADYSDNLTERDKKNLAKFMMKLGFEDVAASIYPAILDDKKPLKVLFPTGFRKYSYLL